MSVDNLYIELQESKATIMVLENYIQHLEMQNKDHVDEIQELRKQLQKARDFEKMASSVIESLSNGKR